MKLKSHKFNERVLAVSCWSLLLLNIGCSAPAAHEPGPAETAGRYVDQGLGKVKQATVGAYRSSRRWLYDTGQRISRGSSAFADSWRNDNGERGYESDSPSGRNDGTYRPEDSYSFPGEYQKPSKGRQVEQSYRDAQKEGYFPEEGSIASEEDFRY